MCNRCGALNADSATECIECGRDRFAPSFVRQLRRVTPFFAVQVTDPFDATKDPDPRLTLSKWWPGVGKGSTLHITKAAQWERVKEIVDTELAPFLGWQSQRKIKEALSKQAEETSKARGDLSEAAQQHPRLITELLQGIEFDRIAEDDVPEIARSISDIAGVLLDADASMRRVIQRMVKQLPKQGEEAIGALSDLMESLTLTQITAVTSEVRRRVGLLEFFKEQVLDDRTYEIRGPKSIHRLLEQAMWIVDERYWLMHSNATLRTIVAREIAKEFKGDEKKRPDFVCGSVDRRLIIIEIKRPSHTLQVEDLNQLERYVVIAQDHSEDTSSFEAYLVGKKSSDDLKKHLRVRGASFKVKTYSDLISDTERRYQKYLEALSP